MRKGLLMCNCGVSWPERTRRTPQAKAAEVHNDSSHMANIDRANVGSFASHTLPVFGGVGYSARSHDHSLRHQRPAEWLDESRGCDVVHVGAGSVPVDHRNSRAAPREEAGWNR